MTLKSLEWQITIDPIFEHFKYVKQLKRMQAFGITHVGKIERVSGCLFSLSEAEDILDALGWFLSFALGADCPPPC